MSGTKQPLELAICMGSSCFSRGNKRNIKLIKEYIERHGLCGKVVMKGHLCEGLCKDGPNLTVDGQVFNCVDSATILALLDQHLKIQE
ncbi:MAG TPA: (2Fe-2S) ferredoxin domain-containing protein [Syntrophobacteraceae bacterium]|nr:(2Fe-2S) ferredoxin domain-containing protein [Syntrophobacteraceae bacterium]